MTCARRFPAGAPTEPASRACSRYSRPLVSRITHLQRGRRGGRTAGGLRALPARRSRISFPGSRRGHRQAGDRCQAVRARLRPRIRWLKPASGFRHNPNKPVTDSMAPIAGVNTHRTNTPARQPQPPARTTSASPMHRLPPGRMRFPAGATPTFAMPTSATPSLTGTALLNTAEHPDPCSDALQGSRNATVPASLVTTGCPVSQLRDVLVPLPGCEASRSCTDPFDGVMDV